MSASTDSQGITARRDSDSEGSTTSSPNYANEIDDVFAAVDRANFPERDGLPEPWKQLGLGVTDNWEPYRWNLWGAKKKCQGIYVSVVEFFTLMSGSL